MCDFTRLESLRDTENIWRLGVRWFSLRSTDRLLAEIPSGWEPPSGECTSGQDRDLHATSGLEFCYDTGPRSQVEKPCLIPQSPKRPAS